MIKKHQIVPKNPNFTKKIFYKSQTKSLGIYLDALGLWKKNKSSNVGLKKTQSGHSVSCGFV